jgi:hypothetical protein
MISKRAKELAVLSRASAKGSHSYEPLFPLAWVRRLHEADQALARIGRMPPSRSVFFSGCGWKYQR